MKTITTIFNNMLAAYHQRRLSAAILAKHQLPEQLAAAIKATNEQANRHLRDLQLAYNCRDAELDREIFKHANDRDEARNGVKQVAE